MTEDQVYQLLLEQIKQAGGQRAFAQQIGVTPSYINDVVNKRRLMSDRILLAIGIERVITYAYRHIDSHIGSHASEKPQPPDGD